MVKRRMATALATAGLLAGIFGSTLAPVAQGAGWAVTAAKLEIQANFERDINDGWYGNASATGTAGNPLDMYAPITNDGGALGTGAIDVPVIDSVAALVPRVDELGRHGLRTREHAEPAERVDLFVFLDRALGQAGPADPMKAIASGDEIAFEGVRLAVFSRNHIHG